MSASNEYVILLTGTSGQVGEQLLHTLQRLGSVVAPRRSELDLSRPEQIRAVVREVRPSLVVNPAAYTAVDRAESERELVFQVNARAPEVLAQEAKRVGAALIHYSTDYVFDGALDRPYIEEDETRPLNAYGESKWVGEEAISETGAAHLIFRTSWVYGRTGSNFFRTMLRLAEERSELRIVADQVGAPTWASAIAEATARIALQIRDRPVDDEWWRTHAGVYHLTAAGATTWAGFANEIFEQAFVGKGRAAPKIAEIPSDEYPTAARRPRNSRLSNDKLAKVFGFRMASWSDALSQCLAET